MAADGGAKAAALLELTVAQVQRTPAAVCAQPREGAVQVPGPAVQALGLGLQPEPLGIAALQRFVAALRNLPQNGVHLRAILPRSAEQLLQAPFGRRLEQEGLGRRPGIPGMGDHQLLQKMRRSAALGPPDSPLTGARRRPGLTCNSATRPTPASDSASCQRSSPSLDPRRVPTLRAGWGEGAEEYLRRLQCAPRPRPTYIQHRGQVPGPTGEFLQLHIALLQGGDFLLFLGQRRVQLQEGTQTLSCRLPCCFSVHLAGTEPRSSRLIRNLGAQERLHW